MCEKSRWGGVAAVVAVFVAMLGCRDRPSDDQLARWHAEALAADKAARATSDTTQKQPWTLTITGRTERGGTSVLSWTEIKKLAVTSIRTRSPQNPSDPTAQVLFNGIRVGDLLSQFGVAPGAQELTFVAHDAFRSTVAVRDAEKYPIVLAIEADGKPIPRANGGPVFLTFPHDTFPETRQRYPDRYWCFYVTHMVVGTMPVELRIGDRRFTGPELAQLPQTRLEETVRYKVHWPSHAVKLRGVALRDLLGAAGVRLGPRDAVVALGLAPIHRDAADPIRFAAEDIATCGIMVATHWGEQDTPIDARYGGPLAIAIPERCRAKYSAKRWVTMLQELRIVRAEPKR